MKKTQLIVIILFVCLIFFGCNSAEQIEEKWTLVQKKAFKFEDGMYVDLWRSNNGRSNVYRLPDGETLLTIQDPAGPDHAYVGGVETLHELNELAQRAVLSYYEKQGLLYDIHTELEVAYTMYLKCKTNGEEFYDFLISQEITPASSNDTMICFLTSVILPNGDLGGRGGQEIRLGAVFNKETGEVYNNWDLFYSPKEEVVLQLLQAAQIEDRQLILEMSEVIEGEYITLFSNNLEISFPQGSLPSQDHLYMLGIDYDELEDIIYDWAIPD